MRQQFERWAKVGHSSWEEEPEDIEVNASKEQRIQRHYASASRGLYQNYSRVDCPTVTVQNVG